MEKERINKDIQILKNICEQIEEHYLDDDWDLTEHEDEELYRITGIEQHDWDDSNLAHYIYGMQRAIHLIECYNPDNSDTKEED